MGGCAMRQPVAHGLRVAVNRLIADARRAGGPEIELCDDLAGRELPPALRAPVLCIVQELLLNACRHSTSRRILVGLGQDDTHIYIQVQDWGIGFNSTAVSPNRRGLKGVRELVQWLGGTVEIDSQVGSGTCVVAELPVSLGNLQPAAARHFAPYTPVVGTFERSV